MRKWIIVTIVTLVLLFITLKANIHFITELWWFQSLGYSDVFWKFFLYKAGLWIFTVIAYFLILYLNYNIASKYSSSGPSRVRFEISNIDPGKFVRAVAVVSMVIISLMAAGLTSHSWEDVVRFFYASSFEATDPIFNNNISYYFFTLPFYKLLKQWAFILVGLSIAVSGTVYIINGAIKLVKGWQQFFTGGMKTHLTILFFLLIALQGVNFWIAQYDLLYSESGVVFGAGFTDVNARLFGYRLMAGASVVLSLVIAYSIWNKGVKTILVGFSAYFMIYAGVILLFPAFQQKFVVEPKEIEKESPYIRNNIEYTRRAYAVDKVEKEDFPINHDISTNEVFQNRTTIDNIRLWDWKPLLDTYRQIQELRLYYTFHDVDVDRYKIKGSYQQFMIAPRELAYERIHEQAQTWVNQRLKYTHGYGIVASPVNVITPEGLPKLVVKNIPPVSEINEMRVDRPAIYYGEETNHYIFTGTDTDEIDYPLGEKNQPVRYSGEGGVPLSSIFRRIVYALDLSSLKILISGYFNEETKIHYHRNIIDRIKKITPWLILDNDPYMVVVDGELKWIIDAYTHSDKYPYSEIYPKVSPDGPRLNYIRNSVKIVIDAYNGDIKFYIADDSDPLVQTYASIFPNLFLQLEECPENIRNHFRYPVDYFQRQAQIYLSYHMSDPELFYNREDMWLFPYKSKKIRGNEMEPYYTIMELEQNSPEFLLILPFTPAKKDNMVAWMAASSDEENYGKLTLYKFPKNELIYGPMQVEARIDQEPSISEVLTLWNQQGSSVIRGNLLVIPISGSVIYVQSLFLQAEQSKMPELKRVIVAHGNNIVMKDNLEEALEAVFSGSKGLRIDSREVLDVSTLIRKAMRILERGKAARRAGEWAAYGEAQKELEEILREIQRVAKKK